MRYFSSKFESSHVRKSDASWNYLTLRTVRFPETPPHTLADCLCIRCVVGTTSRSFTFRNVTAACLSAALPVSTGDARARQLPLLYAGRVAEGRWEVGESGGVGGVPVAHSRVRADPSLSLLIASLYRRSRQHPPGSAFVSISCRITGAMQKTIWHDVFFFFLNRASLCDAALPCPL